MSGWHLDKDLLCYTCREYSPENCCFIPNDLNIVFKEHNQSTNNLPRGVYPKDGKYESAISKFGTQHYLGLFNTVEEAHEIYILNKKQVIIEYANKWKNLLSDKVYEAILSFDVRQL